MEKKICTLICLSLIISLISADQVLFKQCDPAWGGKTLGWGPDTICGAGCLMTSITMAIASMPTWVNPDIMNDWLKQHGGYVNGDNFVWNSVNPLGVQFGGVSNANDWIALHLMRDHIVIANVMNGQHWVWVTGVSNGVYYVHDPGFNRGTYSQGEVVQFGWYTKTRNVDPKALQSLENLAKKKNLSQEPIIAPQ